MSNVRSEVSETSDSGTSAVLDPNGRAHNVQRLINPGSPRQGNNQTLYNQPDPSSQQNNQFPRPSQNDTLVLSDTMINDHFYGALQSSIQPLSLALSGDMQNNQSDSMDSPYIPTAINDLLSEDLFQDLAGLKDLDVEGLDVEQMITELSQHSEVDSYSFDNSANSGYSAFNIGAQNVNINGSMVTGLGSDVDKTRPCHLTLPNGVVFNDQMAVAVRKTDFVPQTPDSAPAQYTQFSGHEDMMLPAIVMPEPTFTNTVNVQPTEESKPKPSSIDENLSLIKMMKVKRKTGAGLVAPDYAVPPSQLAPKQSPQTPYPVQVSSPASLDHIVSPRTPNTPITPSTSTKGPFSIRSYGEKDKRCFELGTRKDLSSSDRMMGVKALFYCFEMTTKFRECMSNPCDLKVANNITAKLCDFDLDSMTHKLVSKVPRDCKYLIACVYCVPV